MELKFDEKGLIPAIVQDHYTKEVLTLAYMNAETLALTIAEGRTVFWSRSRQEIWRKGDTSGNVQHVVSITADCDKDALVVEVTIPANSVPKLSTGMTCRITSDATGDAIINGTLTQIDPVANDKGSFGAKVMVNGDDGGLLIGISAKVEIVVNEKNDVFTVPRDAVGTADDGSSYVLRQTGGEGVDMTFEEVPVTTGDTNDFYVEITGSDLNEGDVIRSTADLTQGIETSDSTLPAGVQEMANGDLYVGDPSDMPEGTVLVGGGDAPAGGPSGPGGGQ